MSAQTGIRIKALETRVKALEDKLAEFEQIFAPYAAEPEPRKPRRQTEKRERPHA